MPLNKEQIAELRKELVSRRQALAAELRSDAEHVHDEPFAKLAGEAHDQADEAVADLIADTGQADLSRDAGELRQVEDALARLKRGSYGRCTGCGVEIELARLRANPAAERCTQCQRTHERTHATAKGKSL